MVEFGLRPVEILPQAPTIYARKLKVWSAKRDFSGMSSVSDLEVEMSSNRLG
jgi:hypothetical protein